MPREKNNESVVELHRNNIMNAAKELFTRKGYTNTTIDDISRESEYSRRTIYTYFKNKNEILNTVVLHGLEILLTNIKKAVESEKEFIEQYKLICDAMEDYYFNSSFSYDMVNQMNSGTIDLSSITETAMSIFIVGNDINTILERYIEVGKENGIVRKDIKSKETVYILWSSISSLHNLVDKKGVFLEKDTKTSNKEFLDYGYKMIINSVLEKRII